MIIVIEGCCYELAVREIPICLSAPCFLASSVEAVVMVDFPTQNDRIETLACDKIWPEKKVGETHCFTSLSIGKSSNHYGEEVEVSANHRKCNH